jgi:hypothetical protein
MRRRDIIVGLGSAAAIPLWAHVNLRLPSWTGFGKTGRSLGGATAEMPKWPIACINNRNAHAGADLG